MVRDQPGDPLADSIGVSAAVLNQPCAGKHLLVWPQLGHSDRQARVVGNLG
jgi:hypothetical protein